MTSLMLIQVLCIFTINRRELLVWREHGSQIKFRDPRVAMVASDYLLRSHEGVLVDATGWGAMIARELHSGTPGDVVGRRRTCARGWDRDGEGGLPALI